MSDKNINKMSFKELRNEIQLLRDDIAKWKRLYEDILYNLDTDNFSSRLVKEKNGMATAIEITAEGLKTKVSQEQLATSLLDYSTITQTATQIELAVVSVNNATDEKLKDYATLAVTRDSIASVVSSSANLKDAESITDLSKAIDTSKTYKIPTYNAEDKVIGENYYYYNKLSSQWEKISGDTIYTMFEQTSEGFLLRGNTVIDGNTTITRNLTLSGNVTWDMSNSPVKTQYSANGTVWHELQSAGDMYMRMSFDGGNTWSNPTKVVGTDGKDGSDGWDGSDANVTPQNVFNALTDDGASQGIFAAFVNKQNKIYINAEYLATKIAEVADVLYIGDYDTNDEQKHIYFNDAANIHTFETGYGQNGLAISSNGFQIHSKPSEIKFISPDGSSFTTGSITLEEYIAEYAGGSGSGYAIFG